MIRKVTIGNYALIDSLEIVFGKGLNTVTGETGAGKSLLLGALSLVQGGRADLSMLRDPSRPCVVEAEFDLTGYKLEKTFARADIDYEEICMFRRVISPSGKSRAFINDVPVTVQVMKELAAGIVDIHSQHQTLLLGSNKFQTDLVDCVAGHTELLSEYRSLFTEWKKTEEELAALIRAADENRKNEEYLRFQLKQLSEAELREGETEELETRHAELSHASEIREMVFRIDRELAEDENGILPRLTAIRQQLERSEVYFHRGKECSERLRATIEELKDLLYELSAEADRIEDDPAKLAWTGERLDLLNSLLQKHRAQDIAALIRLREQTQAELERIGNCDENISALSRKAEELKKKAVEAAARITSNRQAAAPAIEKHTSDEAALLGMPNVKFRVDITPNGELSSSGADRVRFLFTANRNMPLQPLEQIASGGEMSRLMLTLKSLTARHRKLPAVIFDEIDTGISGEVADKMGSIIEKLSRHLQVVNITHLPQVACKGIYHYHVYKEDTPYATNTLIRRLGDNERIEEIAKMLSGSEVTESALRQARTLLRK